MCYTSATTGDPKGVLYSHRSTFLHAMAGCMVDGGAVAEKEVTLPAVPMFHVNAWGMPYSGTHGGAKQVFPGSGVDRPAAGRAARGRAGHLRRRRADDLDLLYQHLKEKHYDLSSLHTLLVGGSAASRAMMENYQRDFGIRVLHAWGMTETSPIGTVSRLKSYMEDWPEEQQLEVRLKQGIPVLGVEAKLIGDHGEDLPWDGNARRRAGRARALDRQQLLQQPRGRRRVHRRRLVPNRRHGEHRPLRLCPAHRSQEGPDQAEGGVDLQRGHGERRARRIPGVLEAAVVGRFDEVCDEVPAVLVVTRHDPNHPVEPQEIIDLLARKFAKWQLPLVAGHPFRRVAPQDRASGRSTRKSCARCWRPGRRG